MVFMYAETNDNRSHEQTCADASNGVRILRFPDVINKTGLSKSAIYERIRRREFPDHVPLGPRAVGFVEHEVEGWIDQLIRRSRQHLTGEA